MDRLNKFFKSCYRGYVLLVIVICYSNKSLSQRIVIEIEVPDNLRKDSLSIATTSVYQIHLDLNAELRTCKIEKGIVKFAFTSSTPQTVYSEELLGNTMYLVEPGDSIFITRKGGGLSFSGKGSKKFELVYLSEKIKKNLSYPKKKYTVTESINDYIEMSNFVDTLIEKRTKLLEYFKVNLSDFAFRYLSSYLLSYPDFERAQKFQPLFWNSSKFNLAQSDLCSIFDSTLGKSYTRKLIESDTSSLPPLFVLYLSTYNSIEYARSRGFRNDYEPTEVKSRFINEYFHAKAAYKGLVREKLLLEILAYKLVKKFGLTDDIMLCINDYLLMPNYIKYKEWLMDYMARVKTLLKGRRAPNFTLLSSDGKNVSLADFKGKVLLIDFWFTGCRGCVEMAPILRKIEGEFEANPNVAFLNISIDSKKEEWLKSLKAGKYTSGGGVSLYTGGLGTNHPVIKSYNINSYPTLFFIDPDGNIVHYPVPDSRKDSGKALIYLIKKELAKQYDGPHVFYNEKKVVAKYINYSKGRRILERDSVAIENKGDLLLTIHTDDYSKKFTTRLKKKLQNEPVEYRAPNKLLALSDIEGNFEAFRKLLQVGGVIDKDFNWTFGNGHLVLNGDFFDRGEQVTECLWLIYSLEEKAKKAGGYVHFILGNHEIMNMSGEMKYVHPKYTLNHSSLLGERYQNLYGENAELGRWLRTKNIVEKIGDILFVHGGIGQPVNELPLTLSEINSVARPYYQIADSASKSPDSIIRTLYYPSYSPFWYRNYYKKSNTGSAFQRNKATVRQIDSTLVKFGVNRIVTGHTIISNSISAHFNGAVINIDTHHAGGQSEALLFENNKYFKLTAEGVKVPLDLYESSFQPDTAQNSSVH